MAGDHELAGRVVVDRLDHFALRRRRAGRFDVRVLQAEHRGHGAQARRHGLLHRARAKLHERDRVAKLERAAADERSELAEAVAREHGRPRGAARLPCAPHGHARSQHGRLRPLGRVERLLRTLLAQPPQIVAEHGRCLLEGRAHGRLGGTERRQHADRL